jgi:uncharacterized protein (TIGR02594 family)
MTIRQIQKALSDRGYPSGPIDGIWGRRTIAAVKEFQKDNGLAVDGIVGPQTAAALFGGRPLTSASTFEDGTLAWFQEARRLLGVREAPGGIDNPRILDWADNLDISYGADSIPWCGLFVAHCIGSTLTSEALPDNPLGARSWLRFGVPCQPTTGAILVFWREARSGWKGHVGFYAGEDRGAYRVLGGNQSNSVSLAWIAKDRLLEARWPATVAVRSDGPVWVTRSEQLSTNEA